MTASAVSKSIAISAAENAGVRERLIDISTKYPPPLRFGICNPIA